MSYILEALRRSQAERERGRVPGLDAQLTASNDGARPPRPGVPWVWVGAGLGTVVRAIAAAMLWRTVNTPAAPSSPVAALPPGPAPAAAPVTGAAVPPTVMAMPATPVQPAAPAPAPAPLPMVVSAPVAPAPVASPARGPLPAPAAPPRGLPAAPTATAAPTEARPIPLAELPPEQRREMPPMTIGGAIYSDNPASRFIMVNGQVVHEGEPAGPGVTVERIGPKAAVLRWRELRIEVPL